MPVFEERIKELSELLDVTPTSREKTLFREIYFDHLKEIAPYARMEHLGSFVDQYKYLLYQANRSYRHENIEGTRKILNKAAETGRNIWRMHLAFQSYRYIK